MEKLKYAQDLIKTNNTHVGCGFNQFINGNKEPRRSDYGSSEQWYSELQGYDFAKKMAKEDGIAFTHGFKCECGGYTFVFGGFWVCNSCGNKDVNKDWWNIKVEKDGNAYCCHGLDFINLQESDNYAFGGTYEESIINYENTMIEKSKHKFCMPDNINSEEEHSQYLRDIGFPLTYTTECLKDNKYKVIDQYSNRHFQGSEVECMQWISIKTKQL